MRKRLCYLLFVIASCVTQGTGQDQQGRREAGVRAVIAKFADARNTHDLQVLVALYANDAESIGPTGVLFARGRPALLEMWSRQVKSVDHVDGRECSGYQRRRNKARKDGVSLGSQLLLPIHAEFPVSSIVQNT
jgi:hypothetical protein